MILPINTPDTRVRKYPNLPAIAEGQVWVKNGEVRYVDSVVRTGIRIIAYYRVGAALFNCHLHNFRKWARGAREATGDFVINAEHNSKAIMNFCDSANLNPEKW